ncbi:transmembrane serine/threonine-protein kinase [Mycolicibacter sinensis]|uniref:Transmembrane serine/threonine-protein kinase n=1 Tax=Mycolicibacter sinensis (strain JDM601) TaxID=875328 RepID=F5Z3R0_MYCSD|nr:sensor domain-containing protein [Mycolicibacter sinensis]AEF35960.1 transmembrane serine/threonine-protein kinase [Mycolicibacter sinensis]
MLFVSYASQDRALVDPLVAVLRGAEQRVWLDEELGGGEAWWHAILERIRSCTVFVVALSNNSLRSKPCQAELAYARALLRPVLPVQIGPVDSVRVTPLAATQIIDYRHRNAATDARLVAAMRSLSLRAGPLPAQLPEEPTVPFAYLMRLSSDLSGPELSYRKQAELVFELRSRLDEDRHDPTVRNDILQLLCRLRDRPDVTVRTRADVDAVLAANDPSFTAATVGMPVAAVTGPRPVTTPPSPGAPTAADAESTGRRWRLGGWSKTKLSIAGAVVAVAAGGAVAVGIARTPSEPAAPVLVDDSDVAAVMATPGMVTVQADLEAFKPSGSVELSRPECLGVLYPGMGEVYPGSQIRQAAWKVLEEPGGLQRAGVNGRPFVDQDIAVFAPKSGQAAAFVERSVPRWRECVGQTVTVTYPDDNTYTWELGDVAGDAPRISQTYTLGTDGYTCERVLDAVADTVIDVKACGEHISGRAGVLTDMIAAIVTRAPAF